MIQDEFSPYKKSEFIKSIVNIKDAPSNRLDEVLFVGRSNVGKSSIINALTNNKKLAYTSSNPGHTKLLNYYLIEDSFYFVDSPGYGFSSKKDKDYLFYDKLISDYFLDNNYLKLVVFLLDSRRIPNEDDLLLYKFLVESKKDFIFVLTKVDKLNMSQKSKIKNNLINYFDEKYLNDLITVSIVRKFTLSNLKKIINSFIAK